MFKKIVTIALILSTYYNLRELFHQYFSYFTMVNPLDAHYTPLFREVKKTTICSTLAVFLLSGGILVTTCSSFCLTLPEVNAIPSSIFPALIPGVSSIVLSFPFIFLSVKHSKRKQKHYDAINQEFITLCQSDAFTALDKDEKVQSLQEHLPKKASLPHKSALIHTVLRKLEEIYKEENLPIKPIKEAFTELEKGFYPKPPKKQKWGPGTR